MAAPSSNSNHSRPRREPRDQRARRAGRADRRRHCRHVRGIATRCRASRLLVLLEDTPFRPRPCSACAPIRWHLTSDPLVLTIETSSRLRLRAAHLLRPRRRRQRATLFRSGRCRTRSPIVWRGPRDDNARRDGEQRNERAARAPRLGTARRAQSAGRRDAPNAQTYVHLAERRRSRGRRGRGASIFAVENVATREVVALRQPQ